MHGLGRARERHRVDVVIAGCVLSADAVVRDMLRRRLRGFSENIPRALYLHAWEPTPALVLVGF